MKNAYKPMGSNFDEMVPQNGITIIEKNKTK